MKERNGITNVSLGERQIGTWTSGRRTKAKLSKVLKLVYRIIEENEEQNVFIKTLSLCITKPSLNSSKFTQELTALSFPENWGLPDSHGPKFAKVENIFQLCI